MSPTRSTDQAAPVATPTGLRIVSVGYEGREISEFARDLKARRVSFLADVRLNAVSRRRGFSKSALRQALAAEGIDYVHFRGLGNPRENRDAFGGADVENGRRVFRQLLRSSTSAVSDLADLQQLASHSVVAVMCFERDEGHCHRQVVIDALLTDPGSQLPGG